MYPCVAWPYYTWSGLSIEDTGLSCMCIPRTCLPYQRRDSTGLSITWSCGVWSVVSKVNFFSCVSVFTFTKPSPTLWTSPYEDYGLWTPTHTHTTNSFTRWSLLEATPYVNTVIQNKVVACGHLWSLTHRCYRPGYVHIVIRVQDMPVFHKYLKQWGI